MELLPGSVDFGRPGFTCPAAFPIEEHLFLRNERPTGVGSSVAGAEGSFRREGSEWSIAYSGATGRIRDVKGVRYLTQLLARPGSRIPAMDLEVAVGLPRGAVVEGGERLMAGSSGQGGPATAGAVASRAGRSERGDARERSRLAVSRCIKSAMARIAAVHPDLGRHLEVTIRCGYDCRYNPDPLLGVSWTIEWGDDVVPGID